MCDKSAGMFPLISGFTLTKLHYSSTNTLLNTIKSTIKLKKYMIYSAFCLFVMMTQM